ncbi:Acid phosphatase type 7 [Lamellibrachia satsuma]|nr:Acid phosphatase type 7 [Lamellibrachia satsuma]
MSPNTVYSKRKPPVDFIYPAKVFGSVHADSLFSMTLKSERGAIIVHATGRFPIYTQPEQVHLSLGDDPTEMVVTWVTINSTDVSFVEYGLSDMNLRARGIEDKFIDGGPQKRVLYMHRVKIRGLACGQKYNYHVGSPLGWSDLYSFKAMENGTNWTVRLAVFGDMGNENARSLGRLQEETQRGHFDAFLHVGDFAYDMHTDNAKIGDAFMNQIQAIAAYVPYMTCVGNHERAYNFSNYKSRFTMPGGDGEGMFYSFNIGPAHVVAFSSEFYYYTNYGWQQIANQYKWVEDDLKEANKPENRAQRPWIIAVCHRPLYCSNIDPIHCQNEENMIRVGLPDTHSYGVEELLYKYGVDIHLSGHEHSYERNWPTYNRHVCNGTTSDNPYHNPGAPVYVVTGSAGSYLGHGPFELTATPWSAFRSYDYGYTRMTILNNTHLYLEQVSDDQKGAVIDRMTLVKDTHYAGMYDCHLNQSENI